MLPLLICGGLVLAAFATGWALGEARLKRVAQVALTLMLAATALAPAAIGPFALAGFVLVIMVAPLQNGAGRAAT
ncbi:MAG: hypothetical protein JXQ91_00440 [Vannielia sp.]|uniref:hypothetical protein n=1 Tax=Rhodobacterales TaxID=204455 RepID=UPI002096069D|nr:hypothetical protein [Oceanicola sp. 502str15]MCO6382606.1 hypothetical protein [Oceanicola sp. 502str15]